MDKWMIHKAQFKGIWSWDYYLEIQKEIQRRFKWGGKAVSSNTLLIGLLKCGRCKRSMFQAKGGKTLINGKPYEWMGYACGNFMNNGTCKFNGIKQEKLDRMVINEVCKLADENTRKAFFRKYSKSTKIDYKGVLERKINRLDRLLKQFDRVNKAYMEGVDSLEEYAKNKSQLLPEIELLKEEVNDLKKKIKNPVKLNWQDNYNQVLKKFIENHTNEDKKKIKMILAKLIDRVEFRKKPFSVKVFYRTS